MTRPETYLQREKRLLIASLEKLLEVAGASTPWEALATGLFRLTRDELRALEYRVRQGRADSWNEGIQSVALPMPHGLDD